MALIALTGTPGTGKTSVSAELRGRGYEVVDIHAHLKANDLLREKDEARDTYEVDIDGLDMSLNEFREHDTPVFLDSHLSHYVDCSTIIVLRCEPHVLANRLRARGYGPEKVKENVQAEILDIILCEAVDSGIPVFEIDCTSGTPQGVADGIEQIIKGNGDGFAPGHTDWTEEMDEWF